MRHYLDSSVILRILLGDPGALDPEDLPHSGTSSLSMLECYRVLDRCRLQGRWSGPALQERQEAVGRILDATEMMSVTENVFNRAAYPLPVPLGTLDAIHLATALVWNERGGEPVTFATHDEGLARAAREMHLPVVGVPALR